MTTRGISIVVPAYNEPGIDTVIDGLKAATAALNRDTEILVVDDGSTDDTGARAAAAGARVIRHPSNGGYGRALLTGIEGATFDTVAIVDADNTYPLGRLADLVARFDEGFDMVVGARQGRHYSGSVAKRVQRMFFRRLSEFTCGRAIPDVNSGFRVFDRGPILQARALFPSGFSFTTTATLLFMLNNLFVGYVPVAYDERTGRSKVRLLPDGLRALQIIVTTIARYNPVKLHLLIVLVAVLGNLLVAAAAPTFATAAWLTVLVGWNSVCIVAAIAVVALMLLGGRMPLPARPRD